MNTVTQFVLEDLAAEATVTESGVFVSPVSQARFQVFFHGRSGAHGMKAVVDIEVDPTLAVVSFKFWTGGVNPMNPGKNKPTCGRAEFHQLCDSGSQYATLKTAIRGLLKPAPVAEKREGVEIPAEMLEQLTSSDGSVIAEKGADGRWRDVEDKVA